jgi:hypothetical protein
LIVLRVVALAAALLVAGLAIAWAITRERKYLRLAWRVVQAVVVLAIALALVYVFQRVLLA